MEKTIAQHLGHGEEKFKPETKTFFLDDKLELDPTEYCPRCESSKIKRLRTHNMDGFDYNCTKCNLTYEIALFKRSEAF